MRLAMIALVLGLGIGLSQTRFFAYAQTATPPTPSGTPLPEPTVTTVAYPDASLLLQQAKTAVKAAKTFRFQERYKLAFLGILADLKSVGVIDLHRPAASSHVTGVLSAPGQKAQNVSEDEVFIKKQAWVKSAKTKSVWKAAKVSDVLAPPASNPTNLLAGTKGAKATGLTTVGPDTVQGVSVWHIHGTAVLPATSTRSVTGPIDYYVGQTGGLLYKASVQIDDPTDGITIGIKVSYSQFAQPVSIPAPTVGSP